MEKGKSLRIRVSKEFADEYKKMCENESYTLSKRVRKLMKLDLHFRNGGKDIIKEIINNENK